MVACGFNIQKEFKFAESAVMLADLLAVKIDGCIGHHGTEMQTDASLLDIDASFVPANALVSEKRGGGGKDGGNVAAFRFGGQTVRIAYGKSFILLIGDKTPKPVKRNGAALVMLCNKSFHRISFPISQ